MNKDQRLLEFLGDSKKRLKDMPIEVKKSIGDELNLAQHGETRLMQSPLRVLATVYLRL